MRNKEKYKMLRVHDSTHKRVMKDREHFEKVIGGGEWSVNDTITEYHKILNTLKDR